MSTELAKAYVQIIPSAKGIKGSISNALDGESKSAGNLAGLNIASKLKTAIAAAGIGKAIHSAITEGGALQQSLGGIETLFKESADKVKANAQDAYKTAGMSANQYMEMVTGFSASLLQGLAGDTNKAADVADMALTDMSDNANKMGTSMELIQNAYQGFAKQNYTMLDNLKLGYGGTQKEMQRLLADAQKITGVKYDINNLSDVYSAIHAIQEEMGITGTTALEASETFSGSFAAMQGALKTFLGNLAIGENIVPSLKALGDTTYTFLVNNFVPMIANVVGGFGQVLFTTDWTEVAKNLVTRLSQDIKNAAFELLGTNTNIVDAIVNGINVGLPILLSKSVNVITEFTNGILGNIPKVINSGSEMMTKFIACIHANIPKILVSGSELTVNLVRGIISNLPNIASAGLSAVLKLFTTVMNNAPKLIQSGLELIGKLAAGLIRAIPSLVSQIPTIIKAIKNEFTSVNWLQLGRDIILGIAKGLIKGIGSIASAAKQVAENVLISIKDKLDINSPSKRAEDEVGMMFDFGVVKGIKKNASLVIDAVKSLGEDTINIAKDSFSYNTGYVNGNAESIRVLGDYIVQAMISHSEKQSEAIKKGIEGMHFTANDREVIRYIESLGFARG